MRPTDASAPAAQEPHRSPAFTLWQCDEQVLANWRSAEGELTRAAKWLLFVGTAQALTLANHRRFGASAQTLPFHVLSVHVVVPAYLLSIALPVVAGYWVSQYLHTWTGTKILLTMHRALVARMVGQHPDGPDGRGERARSSVRGRAGNEASDLAFALTPTASVAGRLPTTVGDTWRDKVGTRATGITVVVVSLGVELSALATFQPFGGAASWEIAAWVVCLLATVAFLVYSGGFAGEPRQWQQDKIQDMFESLERIGSVGR